MFGVQQDEDQDDPDERHDPDSDMEVDDHKAVEESSRSLFPFPLTLSPSLSEQQYSLGFGFYFSSWCVLLVNFCRRSILGIKIKREFGENATRVQVFLFSCALLFSLLMWLSAEIDILIDFILCRMVAGLHLNIEDWNPWQKTLVPPSKLL
jgi:hypothetical protein